MALALSSAALLADFGADDIGKLVAIAIPVVIGIGSWLVNQLQKNVQQQGRPVQRPAPRPPAMAPAPQQGANPADEVEDFLRRVAQRRGAQPAPRVEVVRPAPPAAKPVAPPPVQQPTKRRKRPVGSKVAEHVQQALDSKKFADRASHMTTVDRADESMQEHVKSVFEHRIGLFETETIADDPVSASAETAGMPRIEQPPPAEQLAAALRSPDGMRQALVLGEVLRRPTHRWG